MPEEGVVDGNSFFLIPFLAAGFYCVTSNPVVGITDYSDA
jgi:hypothetical protein